MPLNSK